MPLPQLSPSELNPRKQEIGHLLITYFKKCPCISFFSLKKYQHFLIDGKEGQDDGELKKYPRTKTTEDFCVIFYNIIYTENIRQKH